MMLTDNGGISILLLAKLCSCFVTLKLVCCRYVQFYTLEMLLKMERF